MICNGKSFAGVEPYQNQIKGKIKKGDTLIVKDEKFRSPLFNWNEIINKSVKNYLSLEMVYDSAAAFARPFSCELTLKVEYFSQPDQAEPVTIDQVKLKVSYDTVTGVAYKGKDVYEFSNGYYVKISVTAISSPEFGEELPPIFQLVNRMVIDRKYQPHPEKKLQFTGLMKNDEAGVSEGEVMVQRVGQGAGTNMNYYLYLTWDPINGAEEYDLEWAVFDFNTENQALLQRLLNNDVAVTDEEINKLFENNSTRITTDGNEYNITMVYDARYMLVRMRQVWYDVNNIRNEGSWDYKRTPSTDWAIWELIRHESTLNWQYSATFAEEGKRKEVVSYFDGTARSRQSVTINNADKVAVVQETIYDEFGRAAANILPAPTMDENFHFYKDFNVAKLDPANAQQTPVPYDYRHLKNGTVTNNFCEILPKPLSDVSGAAQYYSPANTFANSADIRWSDYYHKYIPNSFGYPLSVTNYVNDNTGRIRTQGGVGQEFQPGTTHPTRYFYGKPDSWELDRIFGNDVGYANHYQKNMVIDPNGQVSITYLNASGKTIATALSGAEPQMVDKLPSMPNVKQETQTVLLPGQFTFEASSLSLVAKSTYLVSVLDDNAVLSYDIQKLIARYNGNDFQVCSNCYYDLTIKVTNSCGFERVFAAMPVAIGSQTSNCNDGGSFANTVNINFQDLGEHYISFEFKLSDKVIEYYTKEYITKRQAENDLRIEFDFILDFLKEANFNGCFECVTCELTLGSQADFSAAIKERLEKYEVVFSQRLTELDTWISGLYNTLRAQCLAMKPNCMPSPCERYEKPMMDDVSPGGQYSLFQPSPFLALEQGVNVLYNKWRTVFPVYASNHPNYADDSFVDELDNRRYPHDASFTLEDLVKYWKDDWARKFLPFHPEFCKLDFCRTYTNFIRWDEQVKTFYTKATDIPNIPGAAAGLQYSHTNAAWLLEQDPFFKSNNPGAGEYNNFQNDLTQFSTRTMNISVGPSRSLTQVVDYILYCADPSGNINSGAPGNEWADCAPVASCRVPDKEWAQYRDFYFQLKEKYYAKVRNAGKCANVCPVGTPISLFDTCGAVSDFQISKMTDPGSCGAGTQRISLIYRKGAARREMSVTLYYPAEYPGTIPVQVFSIGQSEKFICIPASVDINHVRVKTIGCSGTLPATVCDGTSGELTIYSGRQLAADKFEEIDTVAVTRAIYTMVAGYVNQTPPDAPYCTSGTVASKTFYNCYKVKLPGQALPVTFKNVWVIKCVEDLCTNAPVFNMQTQSGTYKFTSNGKTYYVVLQGGGGGQPNCGKPLPTEFYPCIKVMVGSNPTSVKFANANLVFCDNCTNNLNASSSLGNNTYLTTLGDQYTLYPNTQNGYVPSPLPCTGATISWVPCLEVFVNGSSTIFYNVTVALCLTNNCDIPAISVTSGGFSGEGYRYTKGSGSTRLTYFVLPGEYAYPPDPGVYCSNASLAWYDCIKFSGGVPTISIRNSWVVVCTGNIIEGFAAASGNKATGISNDANVDPVQQVTDYADNSIYYIQSATSEEKTNWEKSIRTKTVLKAPAKKQGFAAFTYKKFHSLRISKSKVMHYRDVWVARKEEKPQSIQLTGNTLAAGTKSKTLLQSIEPIDYPCAGNDLFTLTEGQMGCGDHIGNMSYNIFMNDGCPAGQVSTASGTVHFLDILENPVYMSSFEITPTGGSATVCVPGSVVNNIFKYYFCGTASPCYTPCPDYLTNKQSRFPEPNYNFTPSTVDVRNEVNDKEGLIAGQIRVNCEGQTDLWLQKLEGCLNQFPAGQRETLKQQLRSKLMEVCVKGGDVDHPFGASTTRPGEVTSSGLSSFKQAIIAVFGSASIKMDCNPWLLESPNPYLPRQQAIAPIIPKSSAAICARLQQLRSSHTTEAPGTTFFDYLTNKFGAAMDLTAAQLNVLIKSCDNCKYILDEDMQLPVFLDPNNPGCVTKADYDAAKAALQTELGSAYNETDVNYEEVLSNFLNHRFGFVLAYYQYNQFVLDAGSNQNAILCNNLPYKPIPPDPYACLKDVITLAVINGRKEYEIIIAEEKRKFRVGYIDVCSKARASARLTVKQQIYHYTLYYYDQAGNLVRTVPPEGVRFLSDAEIEKVEKARDYARGNCTYGGPTANTDKSVALQALSSTLSAASNRSIEMWLRRVGNDPAQVLAVTPDKKYLFNSCLNVTGKLLNIDIYTALQTQPDNLELTLSSHATVNLSALTEIPEWTHVVIQGSQLATGVLQVYVNGQLMPALAGESPPSACPWEIGPGNPVVLPENLAALKHLRMYNRLLNGAEIAANAAEGCLSLAPQYYTALNTSLSIWARFNTPVQGAPGTNDPYSTLETQYLPVYPEHVMPTSYAYNSTGQVVQQSSPDGGTSRFWYDYLGRLVISQSEEQRGEFGVGNSRFSYTLYDPVLGRVTEVGEKSGPNVIPITDPRYLSNNELVGLLDNGISAQITETRYDKIPIPGNGIPSGLIQNNLRKRVSASLYKESESGPILQASYYDYDPMGNVKTLWQQVDGLSLKRLDYDYDLISGKVNLISYQKNSNDQFYYQYKYDSENRMTEAWSGTQLDQARLLANGKIDALYKYYLHGPLARMELGTKVQGLDYAYTLDGLIKGINSQQLDNSTDPFIQNRDIGRDGAPGNHVTFNRDEISYSLFYHAGDYSPIGGTNSGSFEVGMTNTVIPGPGNSLYNGNIARATIAIRNFGVTDFKGYSYRYDQVNRLKMMRMDNNPVSGSLTIWNVGTTDNAFKEEITYDGNGNIKKYNRNGASVLPNLPLAMDDLTYAYKPNSNQLLQVSDEVDADNYSEIKNQTEDIDGTAHFVYDKNGNLIQEQNGAENTLNIEWTVYGKISKITKANANTIEYKYDVSGNRVRKITTIGQQKTSTWYIRDGKGNTLAVYSDKQNNQTGNFWLEQNLFGSSRLGAWEPIIDITNTSGSSQWNLIGKKSYEITNHLDNVLAVISDKNVGNGQAEVLSATDYYPFGMSMPGRKFNVASYRYGFNGKENDNDIKAGSGLQQDYGMRIYDPRLGRFLSVDPILKDYPELTPYQFASNRPIDGIDQDGLEWDLSTPGDRLKQYGLDIQNEQKTKESYNLWKIQNGPSLNKYTKPNSEFHQQIQQNANERNWVAAGRRPDGSKTPMDKLAENKHFQKFADNIALPLIEGASYASGIGEAAFTLKVASRSLLNQGSRQAAKSAENFVYRSLTSANAETLAAGKGIFAKAPGGSWTLEQHLIQGSSPKALLNNPWIATSSDINIARSFSSGNGLVRIDLSKLSANSIQKGWMNLPRSSAGYHYSIWQQEVSISGQIPQHAIKVIK
jgi:RHS repeat-associated protein